MNLFRVGRNVAAGMTVGLAYILDEDDTLIPKVRCNEFSYSRETQKNYKKKLSETDATARIQSGCLGSYFVVRA